MNIDHHAIDQHCLTDITCIQCAQVSDIEMFVWLIKVIVIVVDRYVFFIAITSYQGYF